MRDEKEGRKKQGHTNNKAKQHSTKNELPRVGLELTTLYTLHRALYQLSYMYMYISHLKTCTCTCTCTYQASSSTCTCTCKGGVLRS